MLKNRGPSAHKFTRKKNQQNINEASDCLLILRLVFRKDLKRKIICQQDISSRPLSEFYYVLYLSSTTE